MELCPAPEEFGVIMGEPDLGTIILPTFEEDLSNLAHQLLGVPLIVRTYVIHLLGTYVTILCNWLIL